MFDGFPRKDGTRITLSPTDQRACVVGRDKLMLAQWEPDNTLGWASTKSGSRDCQHPTECRRSKDVHFRISVLSDVNSALSAVSKLDRMKIKSQLCSPCLQSATTTMGEGRKKMWDSLPSFFDLPPWRELKDDL